MRRSRRLIWVCAILKCSVFGFFFYINALTTSSQLRTLDFRQATPMYLVLRQSKKKENLSLHEIVIYLKDTTDLFDTNNLQEGMLKTIYL